MELEVPPNSGAQKKTIAGSTVIRVSRIGSQKIVLKALASVEGGWSNVSFWSKTLLDLACKRCIQLSQKALSWSSANN